MLDEVMTHAYEIDVNIDQTSRRLRLQNLRVLMAVIDAGSMGRARRELSITQPAISRSIAELEDTFGVPLLERGPTMASKRPDRATACMTRVYP